MPEPELGDQQRVFDNEQVHVKGWLQVLAIINLGLLACGRLAKCMHDFLRLAILLGSERGSKAAGPQSKGVTVSRVRQMAA